MLAAASVAACGLERASRRCADPARAGARGVPNCNPTPVLAATPPPHCWNGRMCRPRPACGHGRPVHPGGSTGARAPFFCVEEALGPRRLVPACMHGRQFTGLLMRLHALRQQRYPAGTHVARSMCKFCTNVPFKRALCFGAAPLGRALLAGRRGAAGAALAPDGAVRVAQRPAAGVGEQPPIFRAGAWRQRVLGPPAPHTTPHATTPQLGHPTRR